MKTKPIKTIQKINGKYLGVALTPWNKQSRDEVYYVLVVVSKSKRAVRDFLNHRKTPKLDNLQATGEGTLVYILAALKFLLGEILKLKTSPWYIHHPGEEELNYKAIVIVNYSHAKHAEEKRGQPYRRLLNYGFEKKYNDDGSYSYVYTVNK